MQLDADLMSARQHVRSLASLLRQLFRTRDHAFLLLALLVGLLAAIVQGLLIKRIVGALGERRALLFGLTCGSLGFALYAFAPTGYWFWAMMPVAVFSTLATLASVRILMPRFSKRFFTCAAISASSTGRICGSNSMIVTSAPSER